MMKTVADIVRTAEECGKHEAASRVWSEEEHRELLYRLQWYYGVLVIKSVFCFFPIPFLYLNLFFARYAKHDSASMCIHIAFHLPNKTAKDVALRWRWSQVTDFLLELGACVRSTVSCAYNK